MKDFIEQEVSITSLPESSLDTPTVSDNPQDIDINTYLEVCEKNGLLADPELTAETITKLAPYREALTKENTN